ncbi:MAG: Zn-dependent exopeptidase M28 [Planctomycetes bacterium]|nr:Zn-dependent exopeptidase M28 [Planctomycetota bacterium]
MGRTSPVFIFLLLAATALAQDAPLAPAQRQELRPLLDEVSWDRLKRAIVDLEAFETRYIGADNHAAVTEHVKAVFRSLGYRPESHRFIFPRRLRWSSNDWTMFKGRAFENVIATLPGRNRALPPVVLTAHFDSINWNDVPNSRANPNAPAPGADDAGSAMAALFEVARVLKNGVFERDIRFVAFDGEEPGLAGSTEYVNDLVRGREKILAVVNYDMMGYGDHLELEVPQESKWLLERVREIRQAYKLDLDVRYNLGPPADSYGYRGALRGSDQTPFIHNGYAAISGLEAKLDPDIWERHYNPNYHWKTDRVDTLNPRLVENVTRLTVAAVAELARPVSKAGPQSRSRAWVRSELAGAGQFAAAFLLKEGINAVEAQDPRRMRDAALQLKEFGFWGSLAAFTAASHVTVKAIGWLPLRGVAGMLARGTLPLAAGMAVVEALSGRFSGRRVLVGTAAYAVAGSVASLGSAALLRLVPLAPGAPRWVLGVVQLGATLYAGEKLTDRFMRRSVRGVTDSIGEIGLEAGK